MEPPKFIFELGQNRKILPLLIVFILLVALAAGVYLVQKQTQLKSKAAEGASKKIVSYKFSWGEQTTNTIDYTGQFTQIESILVTPIIPANATPPGNNTWSGSATVIDFNNNTARVRTGGGGGGSKEYFVTVIGTSSTAPPPKKVVSYELTLPEYHTETINYQNEGFTSIEAIQTTLVISANATPPNGNTWSGSASVIDFNNTTARIRTGGGCGEPGGSSSCGQKKYFVTVIGTSSTTPLPKKIASFTLNVPEYRMETINYQNEGFSQVESILTTPIIPENANGNWSGSASVIDYSNTTARIRTGGGCSGPGETNENCPSKKYFVTVIGVEPAATLTPTPTPTPTTTLTPSPTVTLTPTPTPTPAGDPVNFKLEPLTLQKNQNEEFDLTLKLINRNYDISAVDVNMTFDKTKLELVNPNQPMAINPNSGFGTTAFNVGNNGQGTIRYSGLKLSSFGNNIPSEITFGSIRFKTKDTTGDATVSFGSVEVTALNRDGNVPISGNQGSTITIGSGPSRYTVFYRVAETQNDLASAVWQSYTDADGNEPVRISYAFQNLSNGVLNLFVQFKDNLGTESQPFTKSIRYIGPDPTISNVSCRLAITGTGTLITVTGNNFGRTQGRGRVVAGGKATQVVSWSGQPPAVSTPTPVPTTSPTPTAAQGPSNVTGTTTIVASSADRFSGAVPIEVFSDDGRGDRSSCAVDLTTLDFVARNTCLDTADFTKDNVDVTVVELMVGARPTNQKIRLDKDGKPVGYAPVLQSGLRYGFLIKVPGTLAKRFDFMASEGTTKINNGSTIELPVGDIAPTGSPDGVINSVDKAELVRQWILAVDAVRAGDFNGDKRVNSVDYSCMIKHFNAREERLP